MVDAPVRTAADVERLRVPDPEEAVPFVLEAVAARARGAARRTQAVVGFCGGPFTVAGYLDRGQAEPRLLAGEGADVLASRRSGTR